MSFNIKPQFGNRLVTIFGLFSQGFENNIIQVTRKLYLQAGRRFFANLGQMSYGGRWDIVQAAQELARQCSSGSLRVADIDETRFAALLQLADVPETDLMIRTGGEQRISNFLLWQAAYAELIFLPVLWPDFGDADFEAALSEYVSRERRYGGVVGV